MDRIVIGKIIKPQGIKGEVKVGITSADDKIIRGLKDIYLDEKLYKVISIKSLVNGLFFKLDGVDDRNQAELLRGKTVSFDREKMPKLEKGRYLVSDIIGCKIEVDSKILGNITDILQYGAADVYVVQGINDCKNFMFPCLKKVLQKVDVENKIITLNKEVLEQIIVYEDWGFDIIP